MESLFESLESLFGDKWLDFSDNLFNYRNRKSIILGNDKNSESSDEAYIYRFPLGKGIDVNLLKINVDTKKKRLTVKYDDDKENTSVHYECTRTIPSDAIPEKTIAETTGSELTITIKRDVKKGVKATPQLNIPVNFSETE